MPYTSKSQPDEILSLLDKSNGTSDEGRSRLNSPVSDKIILQTVVTSTLDNKFQLTGATENVVAHDVFAGNTV